MSFGSPEWSREKINDLQKRNAELEAECQKRFEEMHEREQEVREHYEPLKARILALESENTALQSKIKKMEAWSKLWKEKAKSLRQLADYLDGWKSSEISLRDELLRTCLACIEQSDFVSEENRQILADAIKKEIIPSNDPAREQKMDDQGIREKEERDV